MILSHSNKFIFIHCRKTAGSSIKSYLSQFLGPRDIQIGAWKHALKNGKQFNRRFYIDLLHPKVSLNLDVYKRLYVLWNRNSKIKGILNSLQKYRYKPTFENPAHPTAEEIKEFDPASWSKYFKFCFTRNPYEKVVSEYIFKMSLEGRQRIDFDDFVEKVWKSHKRKDENTVSSRLRDWQMFTVNGKIDVDFVGKYEELHSGFREVCNRIDVPFESHLMPEAKRIKQYDYKSYYGGKEKKLINDMFKKEIEHFGYDF